MRLTGPQLDEIAYSTASALGLDAFVDVGAGADGIVYALEDGGCLKLTTSPAEAAVAMLLLERQEREGPMPGIPLFRHVHKVEVPEGAPPLYGIVREDIHDPFEDPTPEELAQDTLLRTCVRYVGYAWFDQRFEDNYLFNVALKDWGDRKPELKTLVTALFRMRDEMGIVVLDLHADNVGVSPRGELCLRDMSRVEMDPKVMRAVLDRIETVEQAPGLAPV